jgi:hypothetical protein
MVPDSAIQLLFAQTSDMFLGYIVNEKDDPKLKITTSIEHIKINIVNWLETRSGVAEINLIVNLLDAKTVKIFSNVPWL